MSEEMPGADLAPLAQRLLELRNLVDHISSQANSSSLRTAEAIIPRYRGQIYAAMDALGNAIHTFQADSPPPERLQAARSLILDPLRDWSSTSSVFFRTEQVVPRQKGDFEVIEMVRAPAPAGADLRALILNDYYLHVVAAEAFRNRLRLIGERLYAEVAEKLASGHRRPHIVSLDYAGGAQLAALAADPEMAAEVQITCLDSGAAAIRHARQTLGQALKGRIRFQRADQQRWLYGPDCQRGSASIVSIVSLFDQSAPAVIERILRGVYQLLEKGGVLLLGSPTSGIPISEQILLEWVTGLKWHYWDEAEWRALFSRTPFAPDHVRFDFEPLRANVLITAQRVAEA